MKQINDLSEDDLEQELRRQAIASGGFLELDFLSFGGEEKLEGQAPVFYRMIPDFESLLFFHPVTVTHVKARIHPAHPAAARPSLMWKIRNGFTVFRPLFFHGRITGGQE